ncbi:MAG: general secretion pathway protein GspK [Phycisphaerales bacterium]|nr:MAG: general secretion pathway protein GspK [Phycisphaerales bacterium]
MNKRQDNGSTLDNRPGVVLLMTLVLLVVLATLGYTFSNRVATLRHRNQYIIDYSRARYGCDSAAKYALATLEELDPQLVDRPNEPDFSDLFALDELAYQELLAQWGIRSGLSELNSSGSFDDMSDKEDANDIGYDRDLKTGFYDPDAFVIRGPYGPPWPLVTEPEEVEIGPTKVRIEIEDENAKYPLGLALLDDKDFQRETEAGFVTFCEMMQLDRTQIDALTDQLRRVGEIRPFTVDFRPITKTVKTPTTTPTSTRKSTARTARTTVRRKVIPVAEQISKQTTDLAKLFHSSFIDTEALAEPIFSSEHRKESALKYIGLWGSQKVNINTAPRHVLEAAFIFGGNQVEIAEYIIQLRREKTFENVQELKTALSRYSDSISKCEKYITTLSKSFAIRITAVSGVARASTVIAITKEGNKVKKIAVIND